MASFGAFFSPVRQRRQGDCASLSAPSLVAVARLKGENKFEKVGCILSKIARKRNDLES